MIHKQESVGVGCNKGARQLMVGNRVIQRGDAGSNGPIPGGGPRGAWNPQG